MKNRAAGVLAGLLLAHLTFCNLYLLLQCGDVETNPGPPKPAAMKQTRLSKSADAEEGSGRRDSLSSNATNSSSSSNNNAPTLTDILTKLEAMDETINKKLEGMREEIVAAKEKMQADVQELRYEVEGLRDENNYFKKQCEHLQAKMDGMEAKLDDMECRSRRNNLLFYGLPKSPNETAETCERTVKDFIKDTLKVTSPVQFDRVHRVGDKPTSPIIARCSFYKDKLLILKGKGELRTARSRVYINEDFTNRVRDIRKRLTPHLKEAKTAGKRAALIYDHLLIEGKKYVLKEDGVGVVEMGQQGQK